MPVETPKKHKWSQIIADWAERRTYMAERATGKLSDTERQALKDKFIERGKSVKQPVKI